MKSTYLVKAIKKLRPNAEFSFIDDDYSTITWDVLEGSAPTQSEIDLTIEQIKADEAKQEADAVLAKEALLKKLGITADEAKLLLG